MSHRSIIVLPDESAEPIVEAIARSKSSLRVKMFVLSDPTLLSSLIAAHRRGVRVQVMLNARRSNGVDSNRASRTSLESAGVAVVQGNPAFRVMHEKSMVVDDRTAFVTSLNWTPDNLIHTRDYVVITSHAREVNEIIECFDADWERYDFTAATNSPLIWCPTHGRERIAQFIDRAKHRLFVQNERYQDAIIIEHLVRAQVRGVKVHVLARPVHTLRKEKLIEGVGGLRVLDAVGIKVRKLQGLRLHGKMLVADGARAIVGSINLTRGSFDDRRELAIELEGDPVVERLHDIAKHDWQHSERLDLSDGGLLRDLEGRMENVAETLGLIAPAKGRRREHSWRMSVRPLVA